MPHQRQKQCREQAEGGKLRDVSNNSQAATVSTMEPKESPVERVTDPKLIKNPRKVAAGPGGAAAQKAKQDNCSTSFGRPKNHFPSANNSPKEVDSVDHTDKQTDHRVGLFDWAQWITGSCLTDGALVFLPCNTCNANPTEKKVMLFPKERQQAPLTQRLSPPPPSSGAEQ